MESQIIIILISELYTHPMSLELLTHHIVFIRGGGARSLVIGETQIILLENHMSTVLDIFELWK